jgi:hypothetical protein
MDERVHWVHPKSMGVVKIAPGQTLSAGVSIAASYEMAIAGTPRPVSPTQPANLRGGLETGS